MIEAFSLRTFLRHYSLYEFAFKPRIELVLKQQPTINPQFNALLTSLGKMEPVQEEEAEKMKSLLGNMKPEQSELGSAPNQPTGNQSISSIPSDHSPSKQAC